MLASAERISGELAAVADVPVELMGVAEKAAALVAVSAATDRLNALRLRLLAASDDVAAEAGARDAGAWVAHQTRADRREQQRDLRLGWTSPSAGTGWRRGSQPGRSTWPRLG